MTDFEQLTAQDYIVAFRAIAPRLTENQRRMLAYHASSIGSVSARELAELVGYKTPGGANMQYGKIGTYLRDASPTIAGLPGQQSHAFAWFENPPGKEWQWHMHERAIDALRELGWTREQR